MSFINRAKTISGWMSEPELQWLSDKTKELAVKFTDRTVDILEIGSWLGRSSAAIGDTLRSFGKRNIDNSIRDANLYCVDTWNNPYTSMPTEYIQSSTTWMTHKYELDHTDSIYLEFLLNNKALIENGIITPLRMSGDAATKYFTEGPYPHFDMIFIDADHTYDGVKADILNFMPLVKKGGLLCGHDFSYYCDGVMKAVAELVPNFKVMENGTIWYATIE